MLHYPFDLGQQGCNPIHASEGENFHNLLSNGKSKVSSFYRWYKPSDNSTGNIFIRFYSAVKWSQFGVFGDLDPSTSRKIRLFILIFRKCHIYRYRKRQLVTISMQNRKDERRFPLSYPNACTICKMKMSIPVLKKIIECLYHLNVN